MRGREIAGCTIDATAGKVDSPITCQLLEEDTTGRDEGSNQNPRLPPKLLEQRREDKCRDDLTRRSDRAPCRKIMRWNQVTAIRLQNAKFLPELGQGS